jgi:uncharacterized ferredoxin-like protein
MARLTSDEAESTAVRTVAALMAAAARTAPKASGIDNIKVVVLDGEDLEKFAAAMEARADTSSPEYKALFLRHGAASVRKAGAIVFFGVTGRPKRMEAALNCGACGFATCREMLEARSKGAERDFFGPNCAHQILDLGIALGSAAKIAADLNVDNRLMFTIGVAARALGIIEADVLIAIPLSISGKNPYFDRMPPRSVLARLAGKDSGDLAPNERAKEVG